MSLDTGPKPRTSPWELAVAPPPERWDDWIELDPTAWPERVEKHYALVPTICFNCESACGLVAYVDKDTERITKFEGNPVHPGRPGEDHFVLRMLQAWGVDGQKVLLEVNLFVAILTRVALRKIPKAILNQIEEHAAYWADHWKRVFDDNDHRKAQIKRFIEGANVSALLPRPT